MSPAFLSALKAHLEHALLPLMLVRQGDKNTMDTVRPPRVFIGDLPTKQPERSRPESVKTQRDDIPCVLLVPVSGYQQEGESCVSVGVICCVYNNEDGGDREGAELDMALLLSAVTQALVPCVSAPLDSRYRLTSDPRDSRQILLAWEKPDTQPRPFIQAAMLSHWRMKGFELQPLA